MTYIFIILKIFIKYIKFFSILKIFPFYRLFFNESGNV